jgi:hypothetical protein
MASDTGVSRPPNSTATFLLEQQLARGDHALGRRGLVVAPYQLELAAQHAALGIDLVDRHLQARA